MTEQPITSLKGIGEKTGKLFEKLGVFTVQDLVEYYPRAYDSYNQPVSVGELKPDSVMAVKGFSTKTGRCAVFQRCR